MQPAVSESRFDPVPLYSAYGLHDWEIVVNCKILRSNRHYTDHKSSSASSTRSFSTSSDPVYPISMLARIRNQLLHASLCHAVVRSLANISSHPSIISSEQPSSSCSYSRVVRRWERGFDVFCGCSLRLDLQHRRSPFLEELRRRCFCVFVVVIQILECV